MGRPHQPGLRAAGAALVVAGVLLAGMLARTSPWTAAGMVLVIAGLAFLALRRDAAATEFGLLAMVDPLTGILNRRAFMDLAEREMARARRGRRPLTVQMLDLDAFKRINDDFGHAAGDRVLAEFADLVRDCLRPADLLGRYGGEEFCLVLPETRLEDARAVAERIRRVTATARLGALPRPVTVSIGAACCGAGEPCTFDQLLARADRALYRAKHRGRNRVESWTEGEIGTAVEGLASGRVEAHNGAGD